MKIASLSSVNAYSSNPQNKSTNKSANKNVAFGALKPIDSELEKVLVDIFGTMADRAEKFTSEFKAIQEARKGDKHFDLNLVSEQVSPKYPRNLILELSDKITGQRVKRIVIEKNMVNLVSPNINTANAAFNKLSKASLEVEGKEAVRNAIKTLTKA